MRRPFVKLAAAVGCLTLIGGLVYASAQAEPSLRTASGMATCTTNTAGKCTIAHSLGTAPTAILLTPAIADGTSGFMLYVVDGTVNATSYTVKARTASGTNAQNRAIKFSYQLFADVSAPPTSTSTSAPTTSSATSAPSTSATTSSSSPTTQPTTTTPNPPAGGSLADRYKQWSAGPNPTGNPAVWPVSVWMQGAERHPPGVNTPNAVTYKSIGVPQNMGTPDWPDTSKSWVVQRMDESIAAGWHEMPWVSSSGRAQLSDPDVAKVITGWTLGDEPDQFKSNGDASLKPANYLARGEEAQAADPTRPVYSNFGGAFANRYWSGYTPEPGTGLTVQQRYDRDMKQYCDSSGIVSVDIYAYTNGWLGGASDPRRQAWYYGQSVDNLKYHCGANKIAYGFLETGHPFGEFSWTDQQYWMTPDKLEKALWNMVVHNVDGIVYFAHDFGSPELIDDGMLRNPAIKAKATELNARLQSLAPVLNAPSLGGVSVSSTGGVPVTYMHKQTGGASWILAQADGSMTVPASGNTTATFTVATQSSMATVVGENRTVPIVGGKIVDTFAPYGFHVYKF